MSDSIASRFGRSVAVVIGIDNYGNGVPPLKTAANDARRLASILADTHGFDVRLFIDEDASRERLTELLTHRLPEELGPDDRLIFYFAGHGVALDGDDGPNGYLLPQDARRGEEDSYLFMPLVHDALLSLPVRHALIIMDSCFSGAFRWATTRDIIGMPKVVHEERFDRFVKDPAWQVITSTAHDQKASDQLSSGSLGTRPHQDGHSPFALALFEALEGKGDVGRRRRADYRHRDVPVPRKSAAARNHRRGRSSDTRPVAAVAPRQGRIRFCGARTRPRSAAGAPAGPGE